MFKKKHRGKINLQAPNHKTSINCKKMEENLTKTRYRPYNLSDINFEESNPNFPRIPYSGAKNLE